MLKLALAVSAAWCVCFVMPARGAVTFYDDQSAFLSAVQPGFYTESFDSAPLGAQTGGLSFAGPGALPDFNVIGDLAGFENTFPFLIPGGSATDRWMGLQFGEVPLLFTITQGTTTAIAGTWANADGPGNLINGTLTLEVIGHGSHTFPVTAGTGGNGGVFIGAVSDAPISAFRLSGNDDQYPVVNNLILANAVPEPTSLLGAALIGASMLIRRRRAR